jgi:hypothetical protein
MKMVLGSLRKKIDKKKVCLFLKGVHILLQDFFDVDVIEPWYWVLFMLKGVVLCIV